jgi:hypothetical protein
MVQGCTKGASCSAVGRSLARRRSFPPSSLYVHTCPPSKSICTGCTSRLRPRVHTPPSNALERIPPHWRERERGVGGGRLPPSVTSVRYLFPPPPLVQKKVDINRKGILNVAVRANILEYLDQVVDRSAAADGYDIAAHLPGKQRISCCGGDQGVVPRERERAENSAPPLNRRHPHAQAVGGGTTPKATYSLIASSPTHPHTQAHLSANGQVRCRM